MKRSFRRPRVVTLLALGALALLPALPAMAQGAPPADRWTFRLTPYLWGAQTDGQLTFPLPDADEDEDAEVPIPTELNLAFMGAFEARRGSWSILADAIYLNVSQERETLTAPIIPGGPGVEFDAEVGFSGWVGHLIGGYTVARSERSSLDVFGGIRYTRLTLEADLQITGPLPPTIPDRNFEEDVDLIDGIVGVRGRLGIGGKWYAPYHFDIGTGDNEFSWQALAGVGYSFSGFDLIMAYRHLDYTVEGRVLEEISLSGPALGFGFRF